MDEHNIRVQTISTGVKRFYEKGQPYRIYHGSTNATRKVSRSKDTIIDTSQMNNILNIDTTTQTVLVEPNVSMDQLVDYTLPFGLLPPVVMEFPAITVGGGFAGSAGESSSFRHGMFDQTINWIEIVLANGEVVRASEHERADLFEAAAGSMGTFGVITALEVALVEAREFVELKYEIVDGMEGAVRKIEEVTEGGVAEYLEGIMFGLDKGVIIFGRLIDKPDASLPLSRYSRPQDPWFYLRPEEIAKNNINGYREVVPIKDYLFRYDRGAFWTGTYALKYFLTPFNAFTRWALDRYFHTKVMYHALHKSRMADEFIIQDIAFPYATVGQFVEYVHRKLGFYPLWLCPLKIDEDKVSLHPRSRASFETGARSRGMMLNVGLWGPGPKPYDRFVTCNRDIERKTAELGGLKWFYAESFYTEDEFWGLYGRKWYDALREKYHASGLPSVYEKVNVDLAKRKPLSELSWGEWMYEKFKAQWPVRGVYGVLQVFIAKEYLLLDR